MNAEVLSAPPQEKRAEKQVETKLSPIEQKTLIAEINNFRVSPPVPEKSEKSEGSGTSEESEKPETSVESDTLGTSEESEIPGEPKEESKPETSEKSEKKRSFKIPDFFKKIGAKSAEQVTSFDGSQRVRVFLPGEARCVQVSLVGITEEVGKDGKVHFSSKDPFTEFVLQNAGISENSLALLVQYCRMGGMLALLRTEGPMRKFKRELARHASLYNGGITILTQASVLQRGLIFGKRLSAHKDENNPANSEEISEEEASLRNLVVLANSGRSIHFSAITPQEVHGIANEELHKALLEVNNSLDPLEFAYCTTSSMSEAQRRSQIGSLSLLSFGIFLPKILSGIPGPILQMLAGSLAGDAVAAIMAGRGIERKKASALEMLTSIAHIREQLKTNKFLRHRLLTITSVLGITTAAVMLTVISGGTLPLPFLLASPINYAAIVGMEWHKRKGAITKSSEETNRLLQALDKRHFIAKYLARKFPHYSNHILAWQDLIKNRTTVGEFIGSTASVPLILFLDAMAPASLALPTVIALSTLIVEKAGGVVAGGGVLFRDPWKAFLKELPTVQALSDSGKMNVPAQE